MNTRPMAAVVGVAAAALAGALAIPATAGAAVVLFDNFNSDTQALNWPGDASFISEPNPAVQGESSTDLIGNNGPYPYCSPGADNQCVDMDGTTGSGNHPAGRLISTSKFAPGDYTLSFQLGGNQRGAPEQTTKIKLGNWSTEFTLPSNAPWKTYTFTFDTTRDARLKFIEQGPSDQQGNILDNVALSDGMVPEPATWAMMLAGLFGLGAMLRFARTRKSQARGAFAAL